MHHEYKFQFLMFLHPLRIIPGIVGKWENRQVSHVTMVIWQLPLDIANTCVLILLLDFKILFWAPIKVCPVHFLTVLPAVMSSFNYSIGGGGVVPRSKIPLYQLPGMCTWGWVIEYSLWRGSNMQWDIMINNFSQISIFKAEEAQTFRVLVCSCAFADS